MSAKSEADFELTDEAMAALLVSGLYDESDIYALQKCEVESLFDVFGGEIVATYTSDNMYRQCTGGNECDVREFTLEELEKLIALMKANNDSTDGTRVRFSVRFAYHVEKCVKVEKIFKDIDKKEPSK